MKAIRVHEFGDRHKMRIEDVDEPVAASGQVLVRIHAAGINPVDTYILAGEHFIRPQLPFTPGLDGAGTVVETGQGAKKYKTGDRVYVAGSVLGTYAEVVAVAEENVHPLPSNMSYLEGSALGVPYVSAYRALFQLADASSGKTLFIHGASGSVGLAAVQLAVVRGLTVIGTAGTDAGMSIVRQQGAHHVFSHRSGELIQNIRALTNNSGVDIVLTMLANQTLGTDLSVVAYKGSVVIIGSRGKVEINPRDIMVREASVKGMFFFKASEEDMQAAHEYFQHEMTKGTIRPVLGEQFALQDAALAHELVMKNGRYGKITLLPS